MNAKTELLSKVDPSNLKCAIIKRESREIWKHDDEYILKVSHSKEELEKFLSDLDFDYYNGYGTQELYGIVWLKDGTWLDRVGYDGLEWWEHRQLPEIPQELL